MELKAEGKTNREICEKFGFEMKQIKNFINRYNKNQRKIAAGISIKRKGRPPKNYVVSEQEKVAELRYILARKDAKKREKVTTELQLHSDQGFQYTSHAYFKLTKSYNITPSMPRKGNPYDNALAENFFSILKTGRIYRTKLQTYDDVRQLIDEYIYFYNKERIQLKTKLTPQEMRCQYVA